jgi:hypothetical protein
MKLTVHSPFPKKDRSLPSGTRLVLLDVLGRAEDVYPKEEQNRNVFLLTQTGEVIWRVAYHEGVRGHDPFVNAYPEGERIVGCTWEGWDFEIALEDGSLKKLGWTKG